MKLSAPSAERNLSVILATFGPRLPPSGTVLEVASGTGQHVAAFAAAHLHLEWIPSDPDLDARRSIQAYRAEHPGSNLHAALDLDVCGAWPEVSAAAMININMIHISPWEATEGLMAGAGQVLTPGAPVLLYGPYKRNGQHTAPSNAEFDQWLKSKSTDYGVRDLERVAEVAHRQGLDLEEVVPMPANNFTVVFRRR